MISIVNKNPSGMFDAEDQWIQFTEINDSLIIRPATPVRGITLANGFSLEYEGDLRFDFRYSPDEGLTWSPQMNFTIENLKRFAFKKNHWVYFELIIVNQSDSESYFKSIDFDFNYQQIPAPQIYKEGFNYSSYIPYYNHFCIDWTLNVLQKIYKQGIVPKYIERGSNLDWYKERVEEGDNILEVEPSELRFKDTGILNVYSNTTWTVQTKVSRKFSKVLPKRSDEVILCDDRWEDEDYITFWYSLIYMQALRIWFVDVLNDMLWNPKILHNWLQSKGLILGNSIHLDELYYMMVYFYDEMFRKGTLSSFRYREILSEIFEDVSIRGEFLRLIDNDSDDENVTALIPSTDQGWIIGYSSACGYINTDYLSNFSKAWENKLTSIEKYPLYNSENVEFRDGNIIIKGGSELYSGIGLGDPDKRVNVSPERDYYFYVRFSCEGYYNLHAGCEVYNNRDDIVYLADENGNENNNFVNEKLFQATNGDIVFFGEVRSMGSMRRTRKGSSVSILRFPENLTIYKAMPFFIAKSANNIVIKDIRFGLLADKDIYISSAAELYLLVKNNNPDYTSENLRSILDGKIIPAGINVEVDAIETASIEAEAYSIYFSQEGGQRSVQVTVVPNIDWQVFVESIWFKVNPLSGNGSFILNVSANENLSRDSRSDEIIITGSSQSKTINVLQAALGYVFEVGSNTELTASVEGGNIFITGKSNCQGIKLTNLPEWISIESLFVNGSLANDWNGSSDYLIKGDPGKDSPYEFKISLHINANPETQQRVSEFSVQGWDNESSVKSVDISIVQWGDETSISVFPQGVTIPSSGAAQVVEITTKGNWIAYEI